MRRNCISALAVGLLLAGCRVGPNYERPTIEAPPLYRGEETGPADSSAATPGADEKTFGEIAWWEIFKDQTLQQLIRTGLEQNYDLRIAAARVDQARARVRVTRAGQLPTIGVGASADAGRVSENGRFPAAPGQTGVSTNIVGVGLAWELDFWGKFRRASEAARAELLATEEARLTVLQSLVTDLAITYFDLRELDLELEISRRTLESRDKSLRLVKLRQDRGVSSMIDVRQSEVLVTTAARAIPGIERRIEQTENEINFILGQNPGPVQRGENLTEQTLVPDVPPGLPSSMLERRPDIRLAEQALVAANARIGVARAAFYPQITLTSSAGFESSALTDLFSGPSGTWSFVGSLMQPIFEGGRLKGQLEAARAIQQETLFDYQRTIQNAFREVSNSLVAYRRIKELRVEQEKLTLTLRDASRLSRLRYEGGVTSYLEVLDNERQLFEAELQLAQIQRDELLSVVVLYKALGGGWQN